MVDDEVHRLQRIDQSRIAAESGESIAHRGKIDDRGDAGEILEKNARGAKRYFLFNFSLDVPARQCADVVRLDELSVFVPQQVFEEDLEAEGELLCVPSGEGVEGVQPKDRVLPTRNVQR